MKLKAVVSSLVTLGVIAAFPLAFGAAKDLTSATAPADADYPKVGGNLGNQNYSSLTQINKANIKALGAAWKLDVGGALNALSEVSQIKVIVPNVTQQVVDMAIQLHGGGGLSEDFPLASMWTNARALRLADGPDEVHRGVVARLEIGKHRS